DLSVSKADSPDPVIAGNNITYTITVTNNGPSNAQGVSLTDTIPANTMFVSFTPPAAGWSFTNMAGVITAMNPTLAAGSGPQVFTLIVKVNASAAAGSTITNTANVSSTTPDSNTQNNNSTATTTVATSADVS